MCVCVRGISVHVCVQTKMYIIYIHIVYIRLHIYCSIVYIRLHIYCSIVYRRKCIYFYIYSGTHNAYSYTHRKNIFYVYSGIHNAYTHTHRKYHTHTVNINKHALLVKPPPPPNHTPNKKPTQAKLGISVRPAAIDAKAQNLKSTPHNDFYI